MTKFQIQKSDSFKYSNEIVEFWEKYLPGTPAKRLEWMSNNPDGNPIWYLAFEKDSSRIVGTVSVMPRVMNINGKSIRAGIVGDFMISDKFRVFGPALDLQKTVIASLEENKLDFVYTIPNKASIKLGERAGLKRVMDLNYYIKPISVKYYLAKYVNEIMAKIISPVVSTLLKLFSMETYLKSKGHYEEIFRTDNSFDTLLGHIKEIRTELVINNCSEFLQWRYFNNPQHIFRIITYRDEPESELLGFLVFTKGDKRMEIFDVVGLNKIHENKLIKHIINLAKKERVQSICFGVSNQNSYYKNIKKFGFFKTKSDVCVLVHGMNTEFYTKWPYVEGYRNI